MSEDKPSKTDIVKAFAILYGVCFAITAVNYAVVSGFWRVVFKLIDKKIPE